MKCPVCLDTGVVTIPEIDGESAYETACTVCDLPYPDSLYLAWDDEETPF